MKYALPIYLLTSGIALAHGGHTEAATQGSVHWLTTGEHVFVLMLASVAVGMCIRPAVRRLRAALIKA